MKFQPHTIVVLVGPSGCGKSHFADKYLRSAFEGAFTDWGHSARVAHISSDDLRRQILRNPEMHKHNPKMMSVSKEAFDQIHYMVGHVCTNWPRACDFIIVDTTGLNAKFRKKIIEQAKSQNYRVEAVVFDYPDYAEYLRYNTKDPNFLFDVLRKHHKRMPDVKRDIKTEGFDKIHYIKSKRFDDLEISIDKKREYLAQRQFQRDTICDYDFIGDIHGQYTELRQLIDKLGYKTEGDRIVSHPDNKRLILLGDLIDKGPQSFEVVDFVEKNLSGMIAACLWGNHENFVFKYLCGKIPGMDFGELIENYFGSIIQYDSEKRAQFRHLLASIQMRAQTCLIFRDGVATHAPCENKYLGKIDPLSLKKHNRSPQKHDNVNDGETVRKIKDESHEFHPYHIFGHVAFDRPMKFLNKIGIDTGCTSGGSLTAVHFSKETSIAYFTSVPASTHLKTEELYNPQEAFRE